MSNFQDASEAIPLPHVSAVRVALIAKVPSPVPGMAVDCEHDETEDNRSARGSRQGIDRERVIGIERPFAGCTLLLPQLWGTTIDRGGPLGAGYFGMVLQPRRISTPSSLSLTCSQVAGHSRILVGLCFVGSS